MRELPNDIINAVARLQAAFIGNDLTAPLLITVDRETYRTLRCLPPDVARSRFVAQGLDVVEILGMRFTDRLPQGVYKEAGL